MYSSKGDFYRLFSEVAEELGKIAKSDTQTPYPYNAQELWWECFGSILLRSDIVESGLKLGIFKDYKGILGINEGRFIVGFEKRTTGEETEISVGLRIPIIDPEYFYIEYPDPSRPFIVSPLSYNTWCGLLDLSFSYDEMDKLYDLIAGSE